MVLLLTQVLRREVRAHPSAGTGLGYSSGEFSISVTGVSGASYGDADSVATFTVNAQGQITAASSVDIAIASLAVSGLATSQQQILQMLVTLASWNISKC